MDISLAVKNIVLVGDFNVSIFDKYFFIKHEIASETEILQDSQFLSEVCVLNTATFSVTIFSNQIVVTDLRQELNMNVVTDVLKKLITNSSITADAMGINFHWYMLSQDATNDLTKKYFYNTNEIITNNFFKDDNVGYGLYLSKDFEKARLKLDIKPATLTKVDDNFEERVIGFVFNFHVELKNGDNNKNEIIEVLDESHKYFSESQTIIKSYEFI